MNRETPTAGADKRLSRDGRTLSRSPIQEITRALEPRQGHAPVLRPCLAGDTLVAGRSGPVEGGLFRVARLRSRRARVGRAAALMAILGPCCYILLTIGLGLAWSSYDPVRDTQSELGAVDSPFRWVMNTAGFMGLGVCIVAFAVAYGCLLRGGWLRRAAVGLLTLAGTGMIIVGLFPCDSGCADVTTTGRLHGLFSAPGAIGLPGAAVVSTAVLRRDGRWNTRWQVASFTIGALSLASGPLIAAEVLPQASGLLQRAGMWSALAWMVAMALRLRRIT